VVFYWRPGCGFCLMLRRRLRRAGVTLEERNIWEDPEAAAFVRSVAGGNETVPTVVVEGRALVNPSARTVLDRLGVERPGRRRHLGQTGAMRYGVVEGEPGIFPDPVARVMRALGRLVSGRRRDEGAEAPPPTDPPTEPAGEAAEDQDGPPR
jgi:mycoredoxin